MDHGIRGNIQISLVIMLLTPAKGHPDHLCPWDIHFDTRFPWGRSSAGTQQAVLNLSEVPSEASQGKGHKSQFT